MVEGMLTTDNLSFRENICNPMIIRPLISITWDKEEHVWNARSPNYHKQIRLEIIYEDSYKQLELNKWHSITFIEPMLVIVEGIVTDNNMTSRENIWYPMIISPLVKSTSDNDEHSWKARLPTKIGAMYVWMIKLRKYICMNVFIYIFMYVCTYVWIYVGINVCMNECMSSMCVRMY